MVCSGRGTVGTLELQDLESIGTSIFLWGQWSQGSITHDDVHLVIF